jgi:hypothetical protein
MASIAKAAFAHEDQQQDWISQVRSDLWDGELDAVIRACQRFSAHPTVGEPTRSAVAYFTNNQHRMDYPAYRAKGYQIDSGTIESACKQIVTQRLKVAGAIWELDNAVKPAKARAAWLSDQWLALVVRRERLSLPLAA